MLEAPQSSGSRVAIANQVRIAGVACCVPEAVRDNAYFDARFGEGAQQVTKMTGVVERHIVAASETTADLCERAACHLLGKAAVGTGQIDALIFVTQTPDYRLPATACALQHKLGLATSVPAFDVNLGCSGYPYGLWLGSMMIETRAADRVLVLVGDTISKIVAEDDRSTAMLFGDAGSATLLERADGLDPMVFVLGTDGAGARNLIVPQGGFRDGAGKDERNQNPPDKLFMEGGEIFNFTLKAVPALVDALRCAALKEGEDFDHYLFHQANAFMIKHLVKKAKIAPEKAPINIGRFGNTSSATLPLLLVDSCRESVMSGLGTKLGMFGFGVGYSWAGCSTRVSNLSCADLIVSA
jgi:3-oxoacyl-[acyl-carrier-protein] synthase III